MYITGKFERVCPLAVKRCHSASLIMVNVMLSSLHYESDTSSNCVAIHCVWTIWIYKYLFYTEPIFSSLRQVSWQLEAPWWMAISLALPVSLAHWRKPCSKWTSSSRRTETWRVRVDGWKFCLWGRKNSNTCWKGYSSNDLARIMCISVHSLCLRLRGPASDQPDHEGTFRRSDCVAGEAAWGAQLPGEPAGGSSGSHGGADPPKPGTEPENGGGETRGNRGKLAGEGVNSPSVLIFHLSDCNNIRILFCVGDRCQPTTVQSWMPCVSKLLGCRQRKTTWWPWILSCSWRRTRTLMMAPLLRSSGSRWGATLSQIESQYLSHKKHSSVFNFVIHEGKPKAVFWLSFFSGWGGRWHEQRVWFRAHQMSRPKPHGLPTGQRGGNCQPAPPVAEERDAAGWRAAGRAAVLCCQVQHSDLKGQCTAFYK